MSETTAKASTGIDKVADKAADAATAEDEAPVKFTVAELKDKARTLFSCSKHAVAGALELEKANTFTVEAAARKVEAFLKRQVEPSEQHTTLGRSA